MSSLLRIGLMGFGFAGATFHAPVIATSGRTEVAAIATGQPDRAQAAYPARASSPISTRCSASTTSSAVIATPNDTHFALARQAFEAGRHVVVDKPVTLTADEALRLARLANARSRLFAPFHNRRWDGDFLTVRDIVKSGGSVASPVSSRTSTASARRRARAGASRAAAALLDLGPHLIDQALALFGLPETVSATVKTRRDNGTAPDFVHLQLGYPDKDVTLHASALSAIEPARFTLHGTRGSYQKFGRHAGRPARPASPPTTSNSAAATRPALRVLDGEVEVERPVPTLDGQYAEFYRALAASIRDGAPFPVTAQDAVDVMTIIGSPRRASTTAAGCRSCAARSTPRAGRSRRPAPMQRDQPEHSVTNAGERKSAADWSDAFLEKSIRHQSVRRMLMQRLIRAAACCVRLRLRPVSCSRSSGSARRPAAAESAGRRERADAADPGRIDNLHRRIDARVNGGYYRRRTARSFIIAST